MKLRWCHRLGKVWVLSRGFGSREVDVTETVIFRWTGARPLIGMLTRAGLPGRTTAIVQVTRCRTAAHYDPGARLSPRGSRKVTGTCAAAIRPPIRTVAVTRPGDRVPFTESAS